MSKSDSIPLTIERIRERLNYNPETGILTHRNSQKSNRIGQEIGWLNPNGYLAFEIDKKCVRVHRIVWAHYYGEFPDGYIDHINRVKTDNRIKNLRVVTPAENSQNKSMRRDNKTGYKGVLITPSGTYRAQIGINRKLVHLGAYKTPEEANEAYKKASQKYHPLRPT